MAHILVVSGHPDLNHSIANATILDAVSYTHLTLPTKLL